MIDTEKVKRKFDKMFKNKQGHIKYNRETGFAVEPSHCFGMILEKSGVDTDTRNLITYNEILADITPKIPKFDKPKTMAVYHLDWLVDSLRMFQLMGYKDVAIKMVTTNEWPVELIAITGESGREGPDFTPHERFLIAPRVAISDKAEEWIKKETRGEKKRKVNVISKKTPKV